MFNLVKVISLAIALLGPTTEVLSVPSAGASGDVPAALAPRIVQVNPVGNVAAVQRPSDGEARLFYQQQTSNVITEIAVSGPSFNGGSSEGNTTPFPSDHVQPRTPIAAAALPDLSEMHVFFFSTTGILNEYIWDGSTWNGGVNCDQCINQSNFTGAGTGDVLYAMQNPSTKLLRVGFVSADSPSTITEAVRASGGSWGTFPLN